MIHMRRKALLACVLALVLMLISSVAFAATGTVTASSLYLREKPDSSSQSLKLLQNGAKLEIISKSGNWYKVTYGKYTGYVFASYISVSEINNEETLQKGDKGTEVKALQNRLKELGYYKSTCDGNFGNVTVNAVKAFQKMNGLTADGVADKDTLKKLESTSAIKANGTPVTGTTTTEKDDGTLQKGAKGTAVKTLQKRLKELGYYSNAIDGSYGNQTVTAVKAFQKKNSLTANGIADAATQKKLNSSSAIGAKDNASSSTTQKDDGTLQKGDQGTAVKTLQKRLKELGYYSNGIDGSYGNQTVTAVKAFQKKNGLTANGIADAATQKKLNSSSALGAKDTAASDTKDEELKSGASGEAVKTLQRRLKELGYYTYGIDGSYGYRTVSAVKAFQKKNGLTADGVAGAATLKKLNSTSAIGAKDKVEEDKVTDTTLKQSSSGTAVKLLQNRLKELGYYTYGIEGSYGHRTVSAVKAFQKKNGLTADGVAGETTLKKLNSTSAIGAKDTTSTTDKDDGTLKQGSSGEAVKAVQRRLKELGYYSYGIDGSYGARTVTAVKSFQSKNGLTADGVVGATTLKKLNSDSAVSAKGTTGSTSATLNTSQTLKKGDSGVQVKLLQTRLKELGYYTTVIDSDYGYRTATAVSDFQRANGLTVNGTANSTTLKKLMSSTAVSKKDANKTEDKEETYVTERLDWFAKGRSVFAGRPIIQIKDVKTGLVFKGKVLYGTNHLDVEPLTAADTAILLKINGGVSFSWHRRPMLVKHNGHVYAASIYSEPHGQQTITNNNFDGQFCLHFYGSKTHGTDEIKQDHQSAVAEAMKATW